MNAFIAFRTLAARSEGSAWALGAGWFDRAAYAGLSLAGLAVVWATGLEASTAGRPAAAREATAGLLRVQMGVAGFLAVLSFTRQLARERERGGLDLLLLAPLPGAGLLLASTLGRIGGLFWTLVAGVPAILGCAALGGVAVQPLLTAQALVLAVVVAAGGLAAFFTSLWRGGAALLGGWLVLGLWLLLPWLLPAYGGGSPSGLLERELADLHSDPWRAGRGLLQGLSVLLLCCGLGGLFLRRRHVRGAEAGWAERVSQRGFRGLRELVKSPRWGSFFRPLLSPRVSAARVESLAGRDLAFRIAWLVGVGISALAAVALLGGRLPSKFSAHASLAAGYGALILGFTAVYAAVGVSAARRRGTFETLLSANVEPDELLHARWTGALRRGAYLGLPGVVYVLLAAALCGPAELPVIGIATAFAGFGIGLATAATAALWASTFFRRPVLGAAAALLAAWPLSIQMAVATGGSPASLLLVGLLWIAMLGGLHAWTERRFRRWALA